MQEGMELCQLGSTQHGSIFLKRVDLCWERGGLKMSELKVLGQLQLIGL